MTEKGLKVEMEVGVGDVVFFPARTQHYLEAGGDEGLLLVVAYSTGKKVSRGVEWVTIWQRWVSIGLNASLFGSYGSLLGSMDRYLAARGLYWDEWVIIWQ